MATAFLVFAVWCALFTLLALTGPRRPAVLGLPFTIGALLTGELVPVHLAWQVPATLGFVALGALGEPRGWVGLGITAASWVGLAVVWCWGRTAQPALESAMRAAYGDDYRSRIAPTLAADLRDDAPSALTRWPLRVKVPGVEVRKNIPYGEHPKRNRLDVYRPAGDGPFPVLLQVHGGGWVAGNKEQQAKPLLYHLASRGWLCVSINYRLAPRYRWPDPIVDVKRAMAWVRSEGLTHGADPTTLVVTGGSAGGHLAALAALSQNDPALQPGFEDVDTSVSACIPLYAPFDFVDHHGIRGRREMRGFLERVVMSTKLADDPEGWDAASPITRVCADAPPFLVIVCARDSLVWPPESQAFVDALRSVATQPVVHAVLPHAPHGFDLANSPRTVHTVNAVARWLAYLESTRRLAGTRRS